LYGPILDPAGFRVRIFNPDASETEKSGNGIRIFARYLHDAGYVTSSSGTIVTTGGNANFRYLDADAHRIQVDMGAPTFWSQQIPVAGRNREVVDEILQVADRSLNISCLAFGNPHCVVRLTGVTEADVRVLGPHIETHPMFPNRTNVQFLEILARDHIRIRIWERGAGYTLASGTSSCAAASAARRLDSVDNHVRVETPGGHVEIDFEKGGHLSLTGEVRSTIRAALTDDLASALTG
jgi:diaminopimelate epimerase